ncbi:hypothetical protein G3A43_08770 [Paraburkholderia aspalathi]|nr:hypothetical protein [Paraburkholderia aspalathi]MBK3780350.1 hypothetical protein [Paraburkholderia aspalathi]
MVAVVVPRWLEPAPVYIEVSRGEAIQLATRAARNLERELADTEQTLRAEELARRQAWNRRWWVRLLPFLKADTTPESIDVWEVGGGDVLSGLDDVFRLSWLESQAQDARRLAAQAAHTISPTLPVEMKLLNALHNWA